MGEENRDTSIMDGQLLNNCWICGSPADSSEHKFKMTDLERVHGKGPYEGENGLFHFKDYLRKIRGPRAQIVKYDKTLCQHCNTTFSQPFDYAYEKFISWVFENEEAVIRRRIINFFHIYGETFSNSQRNLYKYFAKSFGCRLVEEKYDVPKDISELLYLENFQTGLRISFAVNEDMLALPEGYRIGLAKGGLFSRPYGDDIWQYLWHETFEWLNVFYWYNYDVEQELGFPWVADSQYLHMGTYSLFIPEWHSPFIQMVSNQDRAWIELAKENLANKKKEED